MLRVYSILYLENVWSRPKQTTTVQQVQEPTIMNNEETGNISSLLYYSYPIDNVPCQEENEIDYGTITTYSTVVVMDDEQVATTRQQDDEAVVIRDQDNDKTQQLQETNDSPIINPLSDIPNNQTTTTTLMQPSVCSPGMTTADMKSSLESRRGSNPPPQHPFSPRRILQRAKSSMMTAAAADDNVLAKLKRRSSQFMLLKSNQPHFSNPTFIAVPSLKHSFSSSSSSSLSSARKRSSVLLTEKRKSITRKLKTVLSFHRP